MSKRKLKDNSSCPELHSMLNASNNVMQLWLAQFVNRYFNELIDQSSISFGLDSFKAMYNSHRPVSICCNKYTHFYFKMYDGCNTKFIMVDSILSNADVAAIKARMLWREKHNYRIDSLSENIDDAFILGKLIDFMHKEKECQFYISDNWKKSLLSLEYMNKEVIQVELDLLDVE